MENQHRKIKGYRELSQEEVDLMNEVKDEGERLKALLEKLEELSVGSEEASDRYDNLAYAKKDLKAGIMWAVRAIALPQTF